MSGPAAFRPTANVWPALGAAAVAALLAAVLILRAPAAPLSLPGPWGLLGLVMVLAVAALLLAHPDAALAALAAAVYLDLSQLLARRHGLPSLLPLLAFAGVAAAWRRGGRALGVMAGRPLALLALAYLLVVALSTAHAREPALADEGLAETAKGVALFFIVALAAADVRSVRRAVIALLVAGAFLGGLGALQAARGGFENEYGGLMRTKYAHIHGDVFEPRIAGTLGDPNFFAQALVLLAPLALVVALEERRPWARALLALAAVALAAGTVLTYSRGGALALGLAVALCLIARRVHLRQVALGGAALLLLLVLLPAGFTERLRTLRQVLPGAEHEDVLRPDSSFEKRRLFTATAWRLFVAHPLLGVGKANYTAHFEEASAEVGSVQREPDDEDGRWYPHSLYLEVAAETGILGLAVFLGLLAAGLIELWRARRSFQQRGLGYGARIAEGFAIGLVAYLVCALFLHGHFLRNLWMVLGFAAALGRLASRGRPEAEHA